ncbi:MAG: hypothetical protein U0792_02150 [Gemmataceae bacterium]
MRPLPFLILMCGFATVFGCSGPDAAPIKPPSYDADDMAKAAMVQLDKNVNGTIEGPELDACPGLKAGLAHIDTNNDGKLTQDELKTRFDAYRVAGAVGYSIRVTLDGAPLPDATVTLTPELFMSGAISPATGKTGPDGSISSYQIDGRDSPGLPSGVYRIAVTKDGAKIPARYNTETTLGCEVSAGGRGGSSGLDLKLNSK